MRPIECLKRIRWRAVLGRAVRASVWAMVVIIVLFAYIGFLHLTRGTAVRHVRGVGADGIPTAPTEPQFPLSVTLLTGTQMGPGNQIEVMLNGDGTYPRLWENLRSARQVITLQLYYGSPGRMAETLREILRIKEWAGNLITRLL